ncbi:MAG: S10 family peptidase, partial [Asticcacaulis sp.]
MKPMFANTPRRPLGRLLMLAAALGCLASPALAQDAKPEAGKAAEASPQYLPKPVSKAMSIRIGAKTLNYTATVGVLPIKDDKGKIQAEIVYTAYTLDGADKTRRPVTFAFNGGPGAASVYLHLGVMGPKRIPFGNNGEAPSDPALLSDNPETWLEFTDLVFIDPVGTGFSRSYVSLEETKRQFWGPQQDIVYLSRIVADWLLKNERMAAPKFIAGESYGGYRTPRLANQLQSVEGVGISGLVIISPLLDRATLNDNEISPVTAVSRLPSMAAAHLERTGKGPVTKAMLAEAEAYARGEYMVDLMRGAKDAAAKARLASKVSALTGLDPKLVAQLNGCIDLGTYTRELYRDQQRIASRYDTAVTSFDPYPNSYNRRAGDPTLDVIVAPTTSAAVDFMTRQLGWKAEGRYHALSGEVGRNWVYGPGE